MSASIFVPLDARDFEDVLKSLNLSDAENMEVVSLERNRHKYTMVALQGLAGRTTNAGVQFLLLDDPDSILSVVSNSNLSPLVVRLLAERISKVDALDPTNSRTRSFALKTYRTIEGLMRHRLVVADVELFKRVWDSVKNFDEDTDATIQAITSTSAFLGLLRLNSVSSLESHMSIETLLFILSRLVEAPESAIVPTSRELLDLILTNRRDEIAVWVKENMPDCVDLPLSWTLKVVDLYF
jgi:hypothetical protein